MKTWKISCWFLWASMVSFPLPVGAQILTKPDPKAQFRQSCGIIVFISSREGNFYLNNYTMTKIRGQDTIYIINLLPGSYRVAFTSPSGTIRDSVRLQARQVVKVSVQENALVVSDKELSWDKITEKLHGKNIYYVLKNNFYSIAQLAYVSFLRYSTTSKPDDVLWFSSATLVSGFQVSPGFCIGAGISYMNYDVPVSYQSDHYMLDNVSFLPVFGELRVHFSKRQVAPFLNLNLGYSFLLKSKELQFDYDSYYNNKTYEVTKGGFHLAVGFGLRISVSKFIQIIPSMEYCQDRGETLYSHSGARPNQEIYSGFKVNFFRFNLGVGFQYK